MALTYSCKAKIFKVLALDRMDVVISLLAFFLTLIFIYFNKNYVISNLSDTFPRDDEFRVTAKKGAELSRSGNDEK